MARTRQETRWRVGGETKRARLRAAMAAEGAQEKHSVEGCCELPQARVLMTTNATNIQYFYSQPAGNTEMRTERPPLNVFTLWKRN